MSVFVLKNSSSSDKASGYIPRSGAGVDKHGRVSRLYEQTASHYSRQASSGYELFFHWVAVQSFSSSGLLDSLPVRS